MGDEVVCVYCMFYIFYYIGFLFLCRSVIVLMSYFLYYLVKWNFVGVNRLYLLEVWGVENKFFLEVFRDREGYSIKEKNVVLMF